MALRQAPRPPSADSPRYWCTVVDDVACHDEAEVWDEKHGVVVAVAVADLDDDKVVSLEGEAVVGHGDRGDRGRWDLPGPQLVPKDVTNGHVVVHLPDRACGGHDLGPEPFDQHVGGEPMIAVAVGSK